VQRLNALLASGEPDGAAIARRVSRFECLPHTEGCGTGYAEGGMQLYERVMLGHLTHPSVAMALCLEHGCEKTHNDFFHNALQAAGVSTEADLRARATEMAADALRVGRECVDEFLDGCEEGKAEEVRRRAREAEKAAEAAETAAAATAAPPPPQQQQQQQQQQLLHDLVASAHYPAPQQLRPPATNTAAHA